jgi:hypothetical protein
MPALIMFDSPVEVIRLHLLYKGLNRRSTVQRFILESLSCIVNNLYDNVVCLPTLLKESTNRSWHNMSSSLAPELSMTGFVEPVEAWMCDRRCGR